MNTTACLRQFEHVSGVTLQSYIAALMLHPFYARGFLYLRTAFICAEMQRESHCSNSLGAGNDNVWSKREGERYPVESRQVELCQARI